MHQTLFSLTKNKWDLLFNTSPNQKQTQEVTADSSALTQLWLTTPTKNSQFSCISLLHVQLLCKTIMWLCCFKKTTSWTSCFVHFPMYWQGNWGQQLGLRVDVNSLWRICPIALKPWGILKLHTSTLNYMHSWNFPFLIKKKKKVHILSSATYKLALFCQTEKWIDHTNCPRKKKKKKTGFTDLKSLF